MGDISFWKRYKVDPTLPADQVSVHTPAALNGQDNVLNPAKVRSLPFNTGSKPGVVQFSVIGAEAGKDTAMLACWLSAAPNGDAIAGPRGMMQAPGVQVGLGVTSHIDVGDSVPPPSGWFSENPYYELGLNRDVVLNVVTDYPGNIKVRLYPPTTV